MLLFIEHDAVMATAEARKALADFVGHRPGINLAVFHPADKSDDDVLAAYPAALRERLLLTPKTPRARDLCFWLAYEAGCVWAALRSNGQLTQCEAWVTLVPPAWEKAARAQFGDKRVVVIPAAFSAADAKRSNRYAASFARIIGSVGPLAVCCWSAPRICARSDGISSWMIPSRSGAAMADMDCTSRSSPLAFGCFISISARAAWTRRSWAYRVPTSTAVILPGPRCVRFQ